MRCTCPNQLEFAQTFDIAPQSEIGRPLIKRAPHCAHCQRCTLPPWRHSHLHSPFASFSTILHGLPISIIGKCSFRKRSGRDLTALSSLDASRVRALSVPRSGSLGHVHAAAWMSVIGRERERYPTAYRKFGTLGRTLRCASAHDHRPFAFPTAAKGVADSRGKNPNDRQHRDRNSPQLERQLSPDPCLQRHRPPETGAPACHGSARPSCLSSCASSIGLLEATIVR